MQTHIIYHGGCPDGTVGGWVLSTVYPQAKMTGWRHNDPLPDLSGKVFFVDICPKKEVIESLLSNTNIERLIILDHHKSAERDLISFENNDKFTKVFDMNRAGCRIAWDYVKESGEMSYDPPWWLLVVEAGDLWRHDTVLNCKEYLAALHYHGYLKTIESVAKLANSLVDQASLLSLGQWINEYRTKLATEYAKRYTVMKLKDRYNVAVGQAPPDLRSEVGNLLSQKRECDFSVIVTFDPATDSFWLSFRASNESSVDLSLICSEMFGGGGHPKAAGATIAREDWPKYFTVHDLACKKNE